MLYDFHWASKFGHDGAQFPGCESVRDSALGWRGTAGSVVVLLTDLPEISTCYPQNPGDPVVYCVFNIDRVMSTRADRVTTLLGRTTAGDAELLAAAERLRRAPDVIRKLIEEELTVEQIASWAGTNAERRDGLIRLAGQFDQLDPAVVAPAIERMLAVVVRDAAGLARFAASAANPGLELAASAMVYARQHLAVEELRALMAAGAEESAFQRLFEQHHWMLGSQYLGRASDRTIVLGDQQDFILRSSDGFFDIVEIKRPTADIVRYDESHKNWYPSVDLSKVLGQVLAYLSHLDANLHNIAYTKQIQVYRARATIVIGVLGDEHLEQRKALRDLNASLSRVRVITFTEVLWTARQLLESTRKVIDESGLGAPEDGARAEVGP